MTEMRKVGWIFTMSHWIRTPATARSSMEDEENDYSYYREPEDSDASDVDEDLLGGEDDLDEDGLGAEDGEEDEDLLEVLGFAEL